MNSNTETFNPAELCSRKLWQLVAGSQNTLDAAAQQRALEELAQRRRYRAELERLGKLRLQH